MAPQLITSQLLKESNMPISFFFAPHAPASPLDDFTLGAMPTNTTFTRASAGECFNAAGVLASRATNIPRFQHDTSTLALRGLLIEEAQTNSIRNSVADGVVAGTPGTTPTNWIVSTSTNNVTREVIGSGVEDGIEYVDIKYSGVPSSSSGILFFGDQLTQVPAVTGETWTGSFFFRLVGGSWTNTSTNLWMIERNSGGTVVGTPPSKAAVPTSAALKTQRYYQTHTLAEATAAYITHRFSIDYTSGNAIDFTVRVGLPQLVKSACVCTPIKTSAGTVTRAVEVATITNPNALTDKCWIVKGRTPITNGVVENVIFQTDDETANNLRAIYYLSGRMYATAVSGGATQANLDLGAVANDTHFSIAVRWDTNDFAASINGGAIVTDVSGTNPTELTAARIGTNESSNTWNSTVAFIRTKLTATDAELPGLSA